MRGGGEEDEAISDLPYLSCLGSAPLACDVLQDTPLVRGHVEKLLNIHFGVDS